MGGGGAEEQVAGLGPLEHEVEVVLPREADAAVELEAVPHEQALALAGRGLGHRRRDRPARVVLGDGQRGEVGEGRGPLDREVAVGQAVLERLERTDRPAELLPVLGVLEGRLEDRAARGDGRQRDGDGRLLEGSADRPLGGGVAGLDEHPLAVDLDAGQGDGGDRQGGVDHLARPRSSRPMPRDDEGAEPGLAAGDHGDLVGGRAVDHVGLDAVEHPAGRRWAERWRRRRRGATGRPRRWPACRCAAPAATSASRNVEPASRSERGELRDGGEERRRAPPPGRAPRRRCRPRGSRARDRRAPRGRRGRASRARRASPTGPRRRPRPRTPPARATGGQADSSTVRAFSRRSSWSSVNSKSIGASASTSWPRKPRRMIVTIASMASPRLVKRSVYTL